MNIETFKVSLLDRQNKFKIIEFFKAHLKFCFPSLQSEILISNKFLYTIFSKMSLTKYLNMNEIL